MKTHSLCYKTNYKKPTDRSLKHSYYYENTSLCYKTNYKKPTDH